MPNRYLLDFGGAIIETSAFRRLHDTTFLGILSPKFRHIPRHPMRSIWNVRSDGNRANHSIGVAKIFISIAESLRLSEDAKRYGIAWALLHDIATWPLSHTGEAAFSDVTGVNGHTLRTWMIIGHPDLPERLTVSKELKTLNINPGTLNMLFDKRRPDISNELMAIWQIINSPITPDTLEGINRSANVFEETTSDSQLIAKSLYMDLLNIQLHSESSSEIFKFWRTKSKVYSKWINSKKVIEFESGWSMAIKRAFKNFDLVQSLDLDENKIINKILSFGIPTKVELTRYKPPLAYNFSDNYKKRRTLHNDQSLEDLSSILTKTRKYSS